MRRLRVVPHSYFNDVVFFHHPTLRKVFYSIDRGENIRSFEAPFPAAENRNPLSFHPKFKDWLIGLVREIAMAKMHLTAIP